MHFNESFHLIQDFRFLGIYQIIRKDLFLDKKKEEEKKKNFRSREE